MTVVALAIAAPPTVLLQVKDDSATKAVETFRILDQAFSEAMIRGDAKAIAAMYTETGKLYPPGRVISVRGGESDKVRALDLGADDFVVKPFSFPKLLARVRAQLRRQAGPSTLRFQDLTIDRERRLVSQGSREVRLTPTEYSLLELFALNAGKPMFFNQIISHVWSDAPATTKDTVRVHVGSLRKKLEPDASNPRYVVTEPWIGYRFVAEPL